VSSTYKENAVTIHPDILICVLQGISGANTAESNIRAAEHRVTKRCKVADVKNIRFGGEAVETESY
jgi:hypothetical protein